MKKNKFVSCFLVCLIVLFSFPFSVSADVTWKFVDQSVYKFSDEAKAKLEACTTLPTGNYKWYVLSHDSSNNVYFIGLRNVYANDYIKAVSGKSNGIPYFVFYGGQTTNTYIYKLIGSSWSLITNINGEKGFYASSDLSTVEGHYLGDHVMAVSSTTYSQIQSLLTWMRSIYVTSEEEVIPGTPDYGADIEDLNNKYYEITQSIDELKSELNSIVQEAMSNLQDNLSTVLNQLHKDNVTINNNISSIFGSIRDNIVPSLGSIDTRLKSVQEKLALALQKLDSISSILTDINTKFDISLSSFRDSVINEFTSLKTHITNLFTSLQNQLDQRFNETYNVIMYGNKEGTYEHPELQNKLSEYDSNLESINTNISSASSSITSAGDNVAAYISGFTEIYSGLTNVVGFGAIITFGLAIIFVKKVIGR